MTSRCSHDEIWGGGTRSKLRQHIRNPTFYEVMVTPVEIFHRHDNNGIRIDLFYACMEKGWGLKIPYINIFSKCIFEAL